MLWSERIQTRFIFEALVDALGNQTPVLGLTGQMSFANSLGLANQLATADFPVPQYQDIWVFLKIGCIPNYSHLISFNRDNDQQNHWV